MTTRWDSTPRFYCLTCCCYRTHVLNVYAERWACTRCGATRPGPKVIWDASVTLMKRRLR